MKQRAAIIGFLVVLAAAPMARAAEARIAVVAAENVYGDVAAQIGGDHVSITSIMNNPDQDPHLFETAPSVMRQIGAAQIVIENGAGYDPWMDKILGVAASPARTVIDVAKLVGKKAGDNPHLWYDPDTMPVVARALAEAFAKADPAHKDDYGARLKTFLASLKPITDKIAELRRKYAGLPVTANEPVFGYMAGALGLTMRNQKFQLSIMNDTEPSARDVAAFEDDLKQHKVKVLFFNKQASGGSVERLIKLAHQSRIPVVGISETRPPNLGYQQWMLKQLDDTGRALAGPSS